MVYAHHPAPSVKLPSHEGVKCCVMKMREDIINGICEMFSVHILWDELMFVLTSSIQELEGKIAISLDAWTSSNQHAFLAIFAHYITNKGQLGAWDKVIFVFSP
jgi:hypothetical protein